MKRCLWLLIVLVITGSCADPVVPGGEITIKNDIPDREYNSYVVDRVIARSGMTGFRKTIKPGEQVVIPQKGIKSLRFTRRYKDFSRVYVVKCPPGFNKRVTMKLIDVHTNRLRGGCKLVKRGVREHGGYVKWD